MARWREASGRWVTRRRTRSADWQRRDAPLVPVTPARALHGPSVSNPVSCRQDLYQYLQSNVPLDPLRTLMTDSNFHQRKLIRHLRLILNFFNYIIKHVVKFYEYYSSTIVEILSALPVLKFWLKP